jgi:hypothetical protein
MIFNLLILCTTSVFAWPFPTPVPAPDPMKIKEIALLVKQLHELEEQTNHIKAQIDRVNSVKQSIDSKMNDTQQLMRGHYGFGKKFEIPGLNTWGHDAKRMNNLLSGKGSDGVISQVFKEIRTKHAIKPTSELFQNRSESREAKHYQSTTETIEASRAVSTIAYDNMDEEIGIIEQLKGEIEKSENQKASLDLLTRMVAESALIQAKAVRVHAMQAELNAESLQTNVDDEALTSELLNLKN